MGNDTLHRESVARFMADMGARHENPYAAAPPMFRILWALGWKLRPPHFMKFHQLALLAGGAFGVPGGSIAASFTYQHGSDPAVVMLLFLGSLLCGVGFGIMYARFYQRSSRELNLPPWETYGMDGSTAPPASPTR